LYIYWMFIACKYFTNSNIRKAIAKAKSIYFYNCIVSDEWMDVRNFVNWLKEY